jgi:hypothetical protein
MSSKTLIAHLFYCTQERSFALAAELRRPVCEIALVVFEERVAFSVHLARSGPHVKNSVPEGAFE